MVDTRLFNGNILNVKAAGDNIHHFAGSMAAGIEGQLCCTVVRLYRNIRSDDGDVAGHRPFDCNQPGGGVVAL